MAAAAQLLLDELLPVDCAYQNRPREERRKEQGRDKQLINQSVFLSKCLGLIYILGVCVLSSR